MHPRASKSAGHEKPKPRPARRKECEEYEEDCHEDKGTTGSGTDNTPSQGSGT